MKYSFDNLPSEIIVQGSFGQDCSLVMSKNAIKALSQKKLKISICKRGNNPIINDLQLDIASCRGNIKIFVGNSNAEVKFGENSSGNYDLRLWRGCKVIIGNNTTANGMIIVCADSDFITGSDCMFSSGILIQSADQHGLVDLRTGEIFNNKNRQIVLGDHVWLGRNSTLMPDVNVGNGSIVGTGAIVTSDVPEKAIAVGVPARIVRTDVTWSRFPQDLDPISQEYVESFSWQNASVG
jgi:acetyltransferase-like isoleucine patch superfamily enzyme